MSKTESITIGLSVGVACPLLSFVFFWWTSAVISMHAGHLLDDVIIVVAFTGLGIGLLLNIFFLKRWVAAFYTANWGWVAAVYLGLSAIALAFCMGVPLGTFAVGITGGVYLGRRLRHTQADRGVVSRTLTKGALCAASLTTVLALPIGLMALHEPVVVRAAGAFGLDPGTISGPAGQVSVLIICLALFALQLCSTRAAGALAFRPQHRVGQQAGQRDN